MDGDEGEGVAQLEGVEDEEDHDHAGRSESPEDERLGDGVVVGSAGDNNPAGDVPKQDHVDTRTKGEAQVKEKGDDASGDGGGGAVGDNDHGEFVGHAVGLATEDGGEGDLNEEQADDSGEGAVFAHLFLWQGLMIGPPGSGEDDDADHAGEDVEGVAGEVAHPDLVEPAGFEPGLKRRKKDECGEGGEGEEESGAHPTNRVAGHGGKDNARVHVATEHDAEAENASPPDDDFERGIGIDEAAFNHHPAPEADPENGRPDDEDTIARLSGRLQALDGLAEQDPEHDQSQPGEDDQDRALRIL